MHVPSHVDDAHSRGTLLNTPNHSGWITRLDVDEKVKVLEHGHIRGGVKDHFFGRSESAVHEHESVVRGIPRGWSRDVVNVVSRSRRNLYRGKRLIGAASQGVDGLAALVARINAI